MPTQNASCRWHTLSSPIRVYRMADGAGSVLPAATRYRVLIAGPYHTTIEANQVEYVTLDLVAMRSFGDSDPSEVQTYMATYLHYLHRARQAFTALYGPEDYPTAAQMRRDWWMAPNATNLEHRCVEYLRWVVEEYPSAG